jgi:hypothetical protein
MLWRMRIILSCRLRRKRRERTDWWKGLRRKSRTKKRARR